MLRVAFDMDNTLADFTKGYTTLANGFFETPIFDSDDPRNGVWSVEKTLGLTPKQGGLLWKTIKETPGWWGKLEPTLTVMQYPAALEDDFVDLMLEHEVYFITARPEPRVGVGAQAQTAMWLSRLLREASVHPSVITIKSLDMKAPLAKMLGVTHALDDNAMVVEQMLALGINAWLIDKPYNRIYERLPRVDTLAKFFEILEGAAE